MQKQTILALGADMKNRFLISDNKGLRFGPDIGDLREALNYDLFKKEISKAIRTNRPRVIAHDLHPGYFSTLFTSHVPRPTSHRCRLLPIQHHHAHVASVMQEHGLKKPVIGVSFDGTGFGADGNIWGGEFLLVGKSGFQRLAHLKYYMMPGGEKVVTEPWRMALSILGQTAMPLLKGVQPKDREIVLSMVEKKLNSPLTSSAGRLFDAAAALLGVCTHASYEAEGPVKLEAMCLDGVRSAYKFKTIKENKNYVIDIKPAFLGIVRDLRKSKSKAVIATKFHNTMSLAITETVKKLSGKNRIRDIALSGGVFQNKFLREKVINGLKSSKFNVHTNSKLPVNDLNIALGQYYVSCGTGKD